LVVSSTSEATLPTIIFANTTGTLGCESFPSEFSNAGVAITCPIPSNPFQIDVTSATQLLLNDRTNATVANITPGDSINVFGYYDGTDLIEAEVVRDTSKPIIGVATTGGASTISIASIQVQIAQIQTLLAQLIAQVDAIASSTSP
jgi:hypothetical protein